MPEYAPGRRRGSSRDIRPPILAFLSQGTGKPDEVPKRTADNTAKLVAAQERNNALLAKIAAKEEALMGI